MKRLIGFFLIGCLILLPACSNTSSDTLTETTPELSKQTEIDSVNQNKVFTYRTEEIWCNNNGNRIYGVAYIPDTQEEKKPLVIFSHELGNSHTAGIPYAERLAAAGYAAYTFDFCGGTVGGNQSDGSMIGMSIMTEESDLETVLTEASTWDFVDPKRIILLGGSQGGAVTALAGCRNQEKTAGIILMYPALSAVENKDLLAE